MAKILFPGRIIVTFTVAMVSISYEENTRKRVVVKSSDNGRITLFLLFFLVVLLISGCRKSEIEPEFEPELLPTSLSIALVPGGTQLVTISASDNHGVMVLKAKSDSNALAAPVDYTLLFSDQGSGASNDGSFWIPVPPEKAVAIWQR